MIAKAYETAFGPEQDAVLESRPWPAANRDARIAANVEIARALLRHARPIAEKLGVAWPEALERAVRAHLLRELGIEF